MNGRPAGVDSIASPVRLTVLAGRTQGDSRGLDVGEQLTFGRGHCDLWVPIPAVSRHHGTVFVGPGFVTVTCASSSHPLWIDSGDRHPVLVRHTRTTVVDQPGAVIQLRMRGPDPLAPEHDPPFGEPAISLHLDPDWMAAHHPALPSSASYGVREDTTVEGEHPLRHRREFPVLVALCALMLDADEERHDPPSHEQVAELLFRAGSALGASTVRNYLSACRVPLGLPTEDGAARVPTLALMARALLSGVVTDDDIDGLLARARNRVPVVD